jgi:hypothetical protein
MVDDHTLLDQECNSTSQGSSWCRPALRLQMQIRLVDETIENYRICINV